MPIAALIIVTVSALVAAAVGLGAALGYRRFRTLAFPAYWFAIGGGVLGLLISISVITDWPARIWPSGARVPVDQVTPYMAALKRHRDENRNDPEAALYERISTLIERDREDGRSEDEVRFNAMSQTLSYVADKAAILPDDLVYEFYSMTRDQLVYLAQQKDFDTCSDVGMGRVRGDIELKLSNDLVDRYRSVVVRVIEAHSDTPPEKMGAEPFSVMASQSFATASEATGIPPNEIEELLAGRGDEQKVCKLMKGFFDAMLSQPVEQAGPALRALSAGERGTR
jgi:hypothetical protein